MESGVKFYYRLVFTLPLKHKRRLWPILVRLSEECFVMNFHRSETNARNRKQESSVTLRENEFPIAIATSQMCLSVDTMVSL